MADVVARLKVDSKEYDSKIERARAGLLNLAQSMQGAGKTFADATKEQVAFAKGLGQMETVAKTARGRLSELTKAYTDLRMQYKGLTDAEKQSPLGQALATSLEQLRGRIQETRQGLEDVGRELGNVSDESRGAGGVLSQLADKVTLNIDAIKLFNLGLKAGEVALGVVKDAFFQSETAADEWGRTIEGAKGAYTIFLDTLNGGDWSNFFANLQTAVQGGRDLADAFDRLGSVKANNQFAIALVEREIQHLRVLKQEGQDVDAQLKSATERLKNLRMQGVGAGRDAGARQLANTLVNRVYGAGGRGVLTGSEIGHAAGEYMRRGQAYIDEQAAIYARLGARAGSGSMSVTSSTTGGNLTVGDDVVLSRLTAEEKKQYILAKAVTEGETELQAALGTLTNVVEEQAGVYQQQFRGNRYVLQGSGRGGGGKVTALKGAGTTAEGGVKGVEGLGVESFRTTESMKELEAELSNFRRALSEATNSGEYLAATVGISQTQRRMGVQGRALSMGVSTTEMLSFMDSASGGAGEMAEQLRQQIEAELKEHPIVVPVEMGGAAKLPKIGEETMKAWENAASAVSSVGGALQGLEDPGAKVAGIIANAIATIALTFAKSLEGTWTPWDWIAGAAAGTATMIATIASIKSATAGNFAEGGIVPGNSYSGDNIRVYGLNSGELILNRSQQDAVAAQLEWAKEDMRSETNGGGIGGGNGRPWVSGEQIYLGLTNYLKRSGKGEIVTAR